MVLTDRALNRATLDRQLLLRRADLTPAEAVRRLLALQAQEPATPYLALWNRVEGFDPAALDAAFADGTLVKASLLRLTLHVVHAGDWAAVHNALEPLLRGSRLTDARYTSTGLTAADAEAALPHLESLAAEPRTRVEMEALLAEHLGEPRERLWWALRTFAPLHHAPTGGPWSFGRYAAYRASHQALGDEDRDRSVRALVLRYLEAFGPATPQDVTQFTFLRAGPVREALAGLGDAVRQVEGPGGRVFLDAAGAAPPPEDVAPPPRLLPMWDEVLLAYADRSRVVPPEYRAVVVRRNGDVLPSLLVDGFVAGVWRAVEGGVEVTAFTRLTDATWDGIEAEASALVRFLADREPGVYSRYAHWWSKPMPAAQVRVLGA